MELKELLFREGFVGVLESGLKRITICRGRRDFSPGEIVEAVCAEGDRFLLKITSCEVYRLSEVPREDVRDDGFRNTFALFVGLGNFYPDLEWTDEASVIRFEVIARKGAKIFIICPVRDADSDVTKEISGYVARLEEAGCEAHWPPRDTDQNDIHGLRICKDNCDAIITANEVHIWYDPDSKGSYFDRGMVFTLQQLGFKKRVAWINDQPPQGPEAVFAALDVFGEIIDETVGDEVCLWFDQTDPAFLFEGGVLFALLRLGFKKNLFLINDEDVQKTSKKSFANVFRALADGKDITREDAAEILAALAEEEG